MATKPDPAYYLTSSTTNFFGTYTGNTSAYILPAGYGYSVYGRSQGIITGTATSQFYYTDANSFASGMHTLGAMIAQSRAASFRKRGQAVLIEFQARSANRARETQKVVEDFFEQNPSLASQKKVIAAILPWVARRSERISDQAALEQAKTMAMLPRGGEGMTGDWYGVFSQESTLNNGKTISSNRFLRVGLLENGNTVSGSGEMITGERLKISGKRENGKFQGIVDNLTVSVTSQVSGSVTDEETVVTFIGVGIDERVQGVAALYRLEQ